MRFSALLFLAALAWALVCAQDAPSETTEAALEAVAAEPEATASPVKSASPQETSQQSSSATASKEGALKSLVSKGNLLAQQAKKRLSERLEAVKHLHESDVEFLQELKKLSPLFFLSHG
ncbi:extracellular glycoprotein lacritin isoform X1 [Hyaena hyaena]|uniref:extracellular glycoprotein lacritin isoform X1 n=1 Tax=Hyaena hyaena TaxID=95912 RepID=UPI001920AD7E|nr:extracellular glycoprotein lacritin isoform X1 [Hyaena hyaena]